MTRKLLILLALAVCLTGFGGCLRRDPGFAKVVWQNFKDDLYWADRDLDWIFALERSTMLHKLQQ